MEITSLDAIRTQRPSPTFKLRTRIFSDIPFDCRIQPIHLLFDQFLTLSLSLFLFYRHFFQNLLLDRVILQRERQAVVVRDEGSSILIKRTFER